MGPWADSKLRLHLNAFNQVPAAGLDWPALLGRLACPALLITADPARGALITAAQAADLQALAPGVRVAHVSGAGHCIRREQGGRYQEVLDSFLE